MKKNPFVSYITKMTFFSIAVCFLFLFGAFFIPKPYFSANIPYYIVMFYAVTVLGYASVYFLPKKSKMKFEHIFLLTKICKFFIYIVVLVVMFLCSIEKNTKFAITYLVIFAIYQVFDTITLTSMVKNMKK